MREASHPAEHLYHPPALTGQYDSAAAVTAIAAFHACPRKYFLSTITTGEMSRRRGWWNRDRISRAPDSGG